MTQSHQLVPEFIYEKYRAGESNGIFQGAAMFVDLSGFSTMADVLSRQGAHGAEVLADMMRVVFEPLVNAVFAQGGFVIGYAGDAFNAVFPAGQDSGQAMMRCLSAAAAMQAHTKSHSLVSTPYGEFPIRIKVGIGFGKTTWQIFKSINGRRASYWFRGESLNGAVSGEESAHAGEIVADPIAYELLKDAVYATPVDDCFLIREIRADLPTAHPLSPPKPADDLTGIFLADSIAHLPMAGEFRQVLNLFIDIPASISDEALIAPFMETIYLLQEQYGGFFLRPDLGDKGFNLLMFWGAPTTYENDVERALNFILELSTRTRITLRVGISYHMAYAGFVGASQREDYTAYGWGVNLAARMMERAGEGEFWMDEEAARRAEKHFNFKPIGEYHFKGFTHDQKAFALIGRKHVTETVYQGELVGRGKELESLVSFVEPLKQGKFAGVMILKGEAGIGKSRLVHSFQYSEYFNELSAQWVVCQVDEILRLPFNPFTDWLKKRFELLENQPDELNWVTFSRNIQELAKATPDAELAAELIRTSSVLAALINISVPDSLYESLDAKGRYDNTLTALSVLLRAESLKKPLVLFVEDTHWLDQDTGAFLSYFVRTLLSAPDRKYPIAIIATQRPENNSAWTMDEKVTSGIQLEKLSSANMARLAADIVKYSVADSLLALLEKRADGNPFFAEQILRYLSEQGALALDVEGKYFANEQVEISLPTDVRAVLVARLDRLTLLVKETVQTAAVLGREFEVRILGEMLSSDEKILSHIAQAENANIWAPLSEIEYIFRHALLRDAAYSMQLQARQRGLHGLAVSAMEIVYRDDLEPHYGELAYHAEKADVKEKALHYLSLAGRLSLNVYQNQQAIDYFTRALALVPADDLRAKFDLMLLRVESYYNISNSGEQLKDLDILEGWANQLQDNGFLARTFMRRAYISSALGDFQNVLTYATQSKRLAETARDENTLLAVYLVIPNALLRLGRISEALEHAKEGLVFAENASTLKGVGSALSILGLASLEAEGPAAAMQHQEQALVIARSANDKYLEAMALNNLANTVGLSLGDFFTARVYFEQAYSIAHELGNINGKGITLSNLGWLAGILGDYPAAITYCEQALTILRGIGNQSLEMNISINLSAAAGGLGKAQDAFKWAQDALELSNRLGDRSGTAWAYFYLGYAHLLNNEFEEAARSFLKSIEIRLDVKSFVLVVEARAGLISAYLKMNDQVSAQGEAEHILQYMETNPAFEGAEEPLRIFLALYQILEKTKDPRASIVLHNAIQLLNTQVSKLNSEEARRVFVENVPWRRAIQQSVEQAQ
ncbi:MAG: tetratricopeptide repeat protein [Anaerolineales bacterium]|nr:tetratricopeptide repeat protein [Anaerolineales bacterium]